MSDRVRFHLDENVDRAVADGLRRRGVDVTWPSEAGLIGASDDEHLAFAMAQQRVIVTHDSDFLVKAQTGTAHCGVAYCHVQSRTVGEILGALLLIWDVLDADEMRDHIEFL